MEETLSLGKAIGNGLSDALVVGLVGQLGAGKTQLVKGMALGNGMDDVHQVTSPTFTLVQEYPGRLTLYHVDLYRLASDQDFLALGFDEWVRPGAAVVIEWADRARSIIPDESLWIEITTTGEFSRSFDFTAIGSSAIRVLDSVRNLL